MSASRKKTLPVKVKEENVYEEAEQDQQKQKGQEFDEDGATSDDDDDDEDEMTISKLYNIPKRKTLNERAEAKNKRVRYSHVHGLYNYFSIPMDRAKEVMKRAEEVQANLDPEFPSFIKLMVHSHVRKGPWLCVPKDFYKQHMPQNAGTTVILIGENGEEYRANWLTKNLGFGSGWGRFAHTYKLQEGDAVIFQLVRPLRFKVYIVRNTLTDGDGDGAKESNVEVEKVDVRNTKEPGTREKKAGGHLQPKIVKYSLTESSTSLGGASDQSENCLKGSPTEMWDGLFSTGSFVDLQNCSNLSMSSESKDSHTESMDSFQSTGSSVDTKNCSHLSLSSESKDSHTESMDCFQSTESFVDLHSFSINVNGFALDSELSESVRTKYYELCFSQKSYLHDHLLKSIKPVLAAGMISETVSIADAIRASGFFTSHDDYKIWDKTLEGFEVLGMDVNFLRSRLKQLSKIAQSRETQEFKRYNEARVQQTRLEKEITKLETALNRLKQEKNAVESEIDTLQKAYVQRYEEAARAPW